MGRTLRARDCLAGVSLQHVCVLGTALTPRWGKPLARVHPGHGTALTPRWGKPPARVRPGQGTALTSLGLKAKP